VRTWQKSQAEESWRSSCLGHAWTMSAQMASFLSGRVRPFSSVPRNLPTISRLCAGIYEILAQCGASQREVSEQAEKFGQEAKADKPTRCIR
jgi:hypothetical protein